MLVYHEVSPDSKDSVLDEGLKRSPRGEKGNDKTIAKTDKILDSHRPPRLGSTGLSRDNNNYAFLRTGQSLIDITDGKSVPLCEFIRDSQMTVLEIDVDPSRCFVSDLDAYDSLKNAVQDKENENLESLVEAYWQKIVPLTEYEDGSINRPEVMITYDISPNDINLAHA